LTPRIRARLRFGDAAMLCIHHGQPVNDPPSEHHTTSRFVIERRDDSMAPPQS
jgi:hypothetical protein